MSDDDSDSMMRSMMGFSSFGTQRPTSKTTIDVPPSTGSNAAPVTKKVKTLTIPKQSVKQCGIYPSSGPSSAPASLLQMKPDTNTISTVPTTTAASPAPGAIIISTTTFQSSTPAPLDGANSTNVFSRPNEQTTSSITYVSPTNPAYRLTHSELNWLRNGKRNDRGDTVFFKPGFIDDNPWKVLQDIAREERGVRNEG